MSIHSKFVLIKLSFLWQVINIFSFYLPLHDNLFTILLVIPHFSQSVCMSLSLSLSLSVAVSISLFSLLSFLFTSFGAATWYSYLAVICELWHLNLREPSPPRSPPALAGLSLLLGVRDALPEEYWLGQEFFSSAAHEFQFVCNPYYKTALCHTHSDIVGYQTNPILYFKHFSDTHIHTDLITGFHFFRFWFLKPETLSLLQSRFWTTIEREKIKKQNKYNSWHTEKRKKKFQMSIRMCVPFFLL